jgi:hypothetical protein
MTPLHQWEPWKALALAFGTGAAMMAVIVGLLTLVLQHHT